MSNSQITKVKSFGCNYILKIFEISYLYKLAPVEDYGRLEQVGYKASAVILGTHVQVPLDSELLG